MQNEATTRQASIKMNFTYVYILASQVVDNRFYVGMTSDLKNRLKEHNDGKVSHTAKFRPWKIKNALAFADKSKATQFERYLKTSSGRAFARKHF